ncbi:MAG TPA: aminotransferase class V-fold PLP-dependent enzyme [Vicinamibacterales bacterium]|nr:aminotransferase class V-fold PLP-dependent enzyme [Vicinamibacterales bacterium]
MVSRRTFLRASGAVGALALSARSTDMEALASQAAATAGVPPERVAADESYWRPIQQAFDVDRTLVNLNNGNSSPSPRLVHEALKAYLDESNRLPAYYGGLIEARLDAVRRQLADTFGCEPTELAMTRNATESLHIAQFGLDLKPGDEVVTTDQDYSRMLWAWDQRARRDGIVVKRVQFPVPASAGDLVDRLERALTPRTRVLHFCHITNVTGQLFPVRDLCRLARQRNIVSIVDGAQALGHFPFRLRDLECDVYGSSLHKWLMAPHGTGLLYVRRDTIDRVWPLQAALPDFHLDIRKFEEIGTYPAAARAAVADAILFHRAIGAERKAARLHYLTRRWADALAGHPRVRLLSSLEAGQTWSLAMVRLDGIDSRALEAFLFDKYQIVAYGIVSQRLPGPIFDFQGLRVTPNVYTTVDEIDRFVDAMHDAATNGV